MASLRATCGRLLFWLACLQCPLALGTGHALVGRALALAWSTAVVPAGSAFWQALACACGAAAPGLPFVALWGWVWWCVVPACAVAVGYVPPHLYTTGSVARFGFAFSCKVGASGKGAFLHRAPPDAGLPAWDAAQRGAVAETHLAWVWAWVVARRPAGVLGGPRARSVLATVALCTALCAAAASNGVAGLGGCASTVSMPEWELGWGTAASTNSRATTPTGPGCRRACGNYCTSAACSCTA